MSIATLNEFWREGRERQLLGYPDEKEDPASIPLRALVCARAWNAATIRYALSLQKKSPFLVWAKEKQRSDK